MNIFYLNSDPRTCARYHCDKHVIKMILESAQLLCTAHRVVDGDDHYNLPGELDSTLYKATHINHPCSLWTRQSIPQYFWLKDLFYYLCKEYTFRYEKVHLCETKLLEILSTPPENIYSVGFVDPPKCMPAEFKHHDTIIAYQLYYKEFKSKVMDLKYTRRDIPCFLIQ